MAGVGFARARLRIDECTTGPQCLPVHPHGPNGASSERRFPYARFDTYRGGDLEPPVSLAQRTRDRL